MNRIVNDHEGAVLGVIARRQPITRYQLLRSFQRSPVKSYNVSEGSLYPLVKRMIERRLVLSNPGATSRGTDELSLSELGYEALREWVKSIVLHQTLPQDPLKLRAVSLGELTREERIAWITTAKELLLEKKAQLIDYSKQVRLPYGEMVHAADDAEIEGKLRWLDRMLIQVVREADPEKRATYDWEDSQG